MKAKPHKPPQRAKCPECGQRRLTLQYIRINSEDYILLENGVDGQSLGEDYGESDIGTVYCADCGWEAADAEGYINDLFNKKTKKVSNGI